MTTGLKGVLTVGVLCGFLALAAPATATPITPDDSLSPVPLAPDCPCSGPFLADTGLLPFASGSLTGLYRSVVYQRAGGFLDFLYQVGALSTPVSDLLMTSFAGWSTDVFYYDADSGDTLIAPVSAGRSASGDQIDFHFVGLGTDGQSQVVVIRTDALAYTHGEFVISGSGDSPLQATVSVFEPTAAAVPEPASLTLTALGLSGLVVRLRRRRQ